jgi:hypothetical protein
MSRITAIVKSIECTFSLFRFPGAVPVRDPSVFDLISEIDYSSPVRAMAHRKIIYRTTISKIKPKPPPIYIGTPFGCLRSRNVRACSVFKHLDTVRSVRWRTNQDVGRRLDVAGGLSLLPRLNGSTTPKLTLRLENEAVFRSRTRPRRVFHVQSFPIGGDALLLSHHDAVRSGPAVCGI